MLEMDADAVMFLLREFFVESEGIDVIFENVDGDGAIKQYIVHFSSGHGLNDVFVGVEVVSDAFNLGGFACCAMNKADDGLGAVAGVRSEDDFYGAEVCFGESDLSGAFSGAGKRSRNDITPLVLKERDTIFGFDDNPFDEQPSFIIDAQLYSYFFCEIDIQTDQAEGRDVPKGRDICTHTHAQSTSCKNAS